MVDFVARSPAMRKTLQLAEQLAAETRPVLLIGGRDTGRARLARWIHAHSGRRARGPSPLIRLAQVRGDADAACRDAITSANRGTLILDVADVGEELASDLAFRLARRTPLSIAGSPDGVRVLVLEVDLLGIGRKILEEPAYLAMPPLVQRQADLLELFLEVVRQTADDELLDPPGLAPDACDALEAHPWQTFGELRVCAQRATLLAAARGRIELADLPRCARASLTAADADSIETLEVVERRTIESALARLGGRKAVTARALGISRSTLERRLTSYGARSS